MRLIEKLEEKFALVDITKTQKNDVLAEILKVICQEKKFSAQLQEEILNSLLKRESLGSTGIGNGFAIPHTKIEGIEDFYLTIGRSIAGLDFNAIDNAPVKIIFMLISPKGNDTLHLEFLKRIATLGRNSDFVKFLGNVRSKKEVLELIEEMDK